MLRSELFRTYCILRNLPSSRVLRSELLRTYCISHNLPSSRVLRFELLRTFDTPHNSSCEPQSELLRILRILRS